METIFQCRDVASLSDALQAVVDVNELLDYQHENVNIITFLCKNSRLALLDHLLNHIKLDYEKREWPIATSSLIHEISHPYLMAIVHMASYLLNPRSVRLFYRLFHHHYEVMSIVSPPKKSINDYGNICYLWLQPIKLALYSLLSTRCIFTSYHYNVIQFTIHSMIYFPDYPLFSTFVSRVHPACYDMIPAMHSMNQSSSSPFVHGLTIQSLTAHWQFPHAHVLRQLLVDCVYDIVSFLMTQSTRYFYHGASIRLELRHCRDAFYRDQIETINLFLRDEGAFLVKEVSTTALPTVATTSPLKGPALIPPNWPFCYQLSKIESLHTVHSDPNGSSSRYCCSSQDCRDSHTVDGEMFHEFNSVHWFLSLLMQTIQLIPYQLDRPIRYCTSQYKGVFQQLIGTEYFSILCHPLQRPGRKFVYLNQLSVFHIFPQLSETDSQQYLINIGFTTILEILLQFPFPHSFLQHIISNMVSSPAPKRDTILAYPVQLNCHQRMDQRERQNVTFNPHPEKPYKNDDDLCICLSDIYYSVHHNYLVHYDTTGMFFHPSMYQPQLENFGKRGQSLFRSGMPPANACYATLLLFAMTNFRAYYPICNSYSSALQALYDAQHVPVDLLHWYHQLYHKHYLNQPHTALSLCTYTPPPFSSLLFHFDTFTNETIALWMAETCVLSAKDLMCPRTCEHDEDITSYLSLMDMLTSSILQPHCIGSKSEEGSSKHLFTPCNGMMNDKSVPFYSNNSISLVSTLPPSPASPSTLPTIPATTGASTPASPDQAIRRRGFFSRIFSMFSRSNSNHHGNATPSPQPDVTRRQQSPLATTFRIRQSGFSDYEWTLPIVFDKSELSLQSYLSFYPSHVRALTHRGQLSPIKRQIRPVSPLFLHLDIPLPIQSLFEKGLDLLPPRCVFTPKNFPDLLLPSKTLDRLVYLVNGICSSYLPSYYYPYLVVKLFSHYRNPIGDSDLQLVDDPLVKSVRIPLLTQYHQWILQCIAYMNFGAPYAWELFWVIFEDLCEYSIFPQSEPIIHLHQKGSVKNTLFGDSPTFHPPHHNVLHSAVLASFYTNPSLLQTRDGMFITAFLFGYLGIVALPPLVVLKQLRNDCCCYSAIPGPLFNFLLENVLSPAVPNHCKASNGSLNYFSLIFNAVQPRKQPEGPTHIGWSAPWSIPLGVNRLLDASTQSISQTDSINAAEACSRVIQQVVDMEDGQYRIEAEIPSIYLSQACILPVLCDVGDTFDPALFIYRSYVISNFVNMALYPCSDSELFQQKMSTVQMILHAFTQDLWTITSVYFQLVSQLSFFLSFEASGKEAGSLELTIHGRRFVIGPNEHAIHQLHSWCLQPTNGNDGKQLESLEEASPSCLNLQKLSSILQFHDILQWCTPLRIRFGELFSSPIPFTDGTVKAIDLVIQTNVIYDRCKEIVSSAHATLLNYRGSFILEYSRYQLIGTYLHPGSPSHKQWLVVHYPGDLYHSKHQDLWANLTTEQKHVLGAAQGQNIPLTVFLDQRLETKKSVIFHDGNNNLPLFLLIHNAKYPLHACPAPHNTPESSNTNSDVSALMGLLQSIRQPTSKPVYDIATRLLSIFSPPELYYTTSRESEEINLLSDHPASSIARDHETLENKYSRAIAAKSRVGNLYLRNHSNLDCPQPWVPILMGIKYLYDNDLGRFTLDMSYTQTLDMYVHAFKHDATTSSTLSASIFKELLANAFDTTEYTSMLITMMFQISNAQLHRLREGQAQLVQNDHISKPIPYGYAQAVTKNNTIAIDKTGSNHGDLSSKRLVTQLTHESLSSDAFPLIETLCSLPVMVNLATVVYDPNIIDQPFSQDENSKSHRASPQVMTITLPLETHCLICCSLSKFLIHKKSVEGETQFLRESEPIQQHHYAIFRQFIQYGLLPTHGHLSGLFSSIMVLSVPHSKSTIKMLNDIGYFARCDLNYHFEPHYHRVRYRSPVYLEMVNIALRFRAKLTLAPNNKPTPTFYSTIKETALKVDPGASMDIQHRRVLLAFLRSGLKRIPSVEEFNQSRINDTRIGIEPDLMVRWKGGDQAEVVDYPSAIFGFPFQIVSLSDEAYRMLFQPTMHFRQSLSHFPPDSALRYMTTLRQADDIQTLTDIIKRFSVDIKEQDQPSHDEARPSLPQTYDPASHPPWRIVLPCLAQSTHARLNQAFLYSMRMHISLGQSESSLQPLVSFSELETFYEDMLLVCNTMYITVLHALVEHPQSEVSQFFKQIFPTNEFDYSDPTRTLEQHLEYFFLTQNQFNPMNNMSQHEMHSCRNSDIQPVERDCEDYDDWPVDDDIDTNTISTFLHETETLDDHWKKLDSFPNTYNPSYREGPQLVSVPSYTCGLLWYIMDHVNQPSVDDLMTLLVTCKASVLYLNPMGEHILHHALVRHWDETSLFFLLHSIGVERVICHRTRFGATILDYLIYTDAYDQSPEFYRFVENQFHSICPDES